jgi:hypothetical protein
MTDIAVYTQSLLPENLSWDLGTEDQGYAINGTLDVTAFTQAQHFANGFIPSGAVLGLASGLLGPYLNASGTRQTAAGILKASVKVVNDNGTLKAKVGVALWVAYRPVSVAKLPFNSTNQALGGYLDAPGQADLPLIYFAA